MKPCPQCNSLVIWKGCSPRSCQLICNRCGKNWRGPDAEQYCDFGTLIGDWDKIEIYKLELQLRGDKPARDWYFYKGNKIWTAWRNWWEAGDVIVVSILDDLIYWVGKEANDPHWRKEYKR